MDHNTLLIILGAAVAVLLLAILLLRSRKQRVSLGDVAAPPPRAVARSVEPEPMVIHTDEEAEIISAAAMGNAPLEAVAPAVAAQAPAAGDPLTRIKGLGPKAAARLAELGVTRFAQIAGWSAADVARIDAELGPFKGRIERDRWVEQARFLAAGDRAGFEATFGKLGG